MKTAVRDVRDVRLAKESCSVYPDCFTCPFPKCLFEERKNKRLQFIDLLKEIRYEKS